MVSSTLAPRAMPKITIGNTTETDIENHFAPLSAPIIIPTSTAHVMVPRNVNRKLSRATQRTMAPHAPRYLPAFLIATTLMGFDGTA